MLAEDFINIKKYSWDRGLDVVVEGEAVQITEAGPSVCEVCGEGPLQRVLHPVAVHYKGSGFYSTDYGRKGRTQVKEGAGAGDSSSSDSGGAKSPSSDSGGSKSS